jgi:hypothetical protein
MKLIPRVTKAEADAAPRATLTEEAAAQAMWLYYRDHKLQLITDIREYRAGILAQLSAGVAVEDVFAPYFKPAEPAKRMRRAA